jgi:hypothetical protein
MSATDKRRAGRKSGLGPRLVTASPLPQDEQALLKAYRAMDDEGRHDTLRMANWQVENYPAQTQRGLRVTFMVVTQAQEHAILRDFRSLGAEAKDFVCRTAAAIAEDEARRAKAQQPLRLITGGRL